MNRCYLSSLRLVKPIFSQNNVLRIVSSPFTSVRNRELDANALYITGVVHRSFHSSSPIYLAKGKNKGKGNTRGKGKSRLSSDDDGADDDEDEQDEVVVVNVPQPSEFKEKMDKRIAILYEDFDKIRSLSVRADMFSHVMVNVDGTRLLMADVCQVSLVNPTTFEFSVYDPESVKPVEKALRECTAPKVNPVKGDRDNVLTCKVLKPSKEARVMLMKQALNIAEKCKSDIRMIRKNALDKYKKLKSKISDDEIRRHTKSIEAFSDQALKKIDSSMKTKEATLLSA